MYGWRGRIGLIVPASNTTCEQEMARLCPDGVITFSARISLEPTIAGLRQMIVNTGKAAAELSCENLSDLICFCCTVGSLLEGEGTAEGIIKTIRDTAGVPAITPGTAVIDALRQFGVKKVAVATAYTADMDECEKATLEQYGFEVTAIKGLFNHVDPKDYSNSRMVGRCTPQDTYRIARSVDSPDAEAIFISCTNLRAIEVLGALERDLGKPVVSSNQAAMWLALRELGIRESIKGYGRLLESC